MRDGRRKARPEGGIGSVRRIALTRGDENGKILYDLLDAVHPLKDIPAPARFLPEFDNLLFSHADRSRIIRDDHRKRLIQGNRAVTSVLSDGFVCGGWKIERNRNTAVLTIETFEPLSRSAESELASEGERLLRFAAGGADHDIRFTIDE